jgi:hypothetical protein
METQTLVTVDQFRTEKGERLMRTDTGFSLEIRQVVTFYALAFVITWLILSLLIFIPAMKDFAFLLIIGAYGPLVAGLITTQIFEGRAGLKAWLKTVFKLRVGLRWHLMGILFLPALIAFLHLMLFLALGGSAELSTDPPWY